LKSKQREVVVAVAVSAALVGAMEGVYRPARAQRLAHAHVERMSRDLNLTSDQAREIEEILREQADAQVVLTEHSFDEESDDSRASRPAYRYRVDAVLTEEQRERLRRMRAERRGQGQPRDRGDEP
jgi:Spy/CpxP family protein refolding chaperone